MLLMPMDTLDAHGVLIFCFSHIPLSAEMIQ